MDRQLALLSECACAEIQRGGWGEANGLEAAADLLERVSEAAASYVRCAGLAAGGGRGAADVRGAEGDAVAVAVAVTGALLLRP